MAERVLTRRRLNRALLARQLLLDRAALTPARAVERVGGLQTQYAPSGYIGLWSRLAGFRRADLTRALERRRIVQGWVMRCTIHMVSARDYVPLIEAVRAERRRWWLRTHKELAVVGMPAVAAAVRRHLADGPRKQAQLVELLAADGFPREVFPGAQLWVDLVRVPPAGTWERPRAHVYGLAEQWLPDGAADRQAAEELLVTRYLRGFGPASASSIARFCGFPVTATRAVLGRLELRRFRAESGEELVDLPRAPLPDANTPAPVRFLSTFDAVLLLGHARRAGIVPEEHRSKLFDPARPQSVPTFLVDGRVAGTWRWADDRVRWEPFDELAAPVRRQVAEEAERLAAFHTDT
ncbi:winged helix DNA-binding domain-containing protein [Pseudonocardia asaccharolytica]|uniref:winged helix DNA-binding domain-containing protein n=1 Tax=Pseudonocardia asaccharolytica TaxID=54010 RepID=UPI0005689C5E|nr:winged helix DNA-binding domain-containing protein [Pseudonocardia asaccharolytica]